MTRAGTLAVGTAVLAALLAPDSAALYWTALTLAVLGVALVLTDAAGAAATARRRRAARARTRARLDAERADRARRRDTWEQPVVDLAAGRLTADVLRADVILGASVTSPAAVASVPQPREPELFGWAADPRDPDALESRHAAARARARHALRV